MIRSTILVLALSTTSVYAQNVPVDAAATQAGAGAGGGAAGGGAAAGATGAAAAAGVTGFVPLVAPALGVVAAGVGLAAAAGGGGSTNSTTSTVGTN